MQRGRIGTGTLIFFALVAAGAYWCWRFFPAYFQAWQVDSALSDGAARCYKVSHLKDPLRSQNERDLVNTVKSKIARLGITDPRLAVTLDYAGNQAILRADYEVTVSHPYVNFSTVLSMHRSASADLKRVSWD